MTDLRRVSRGQRTMALGLITLAFTACFAVWTIFSIIGVKIKADLGLNDSQFGMLIATPILTGSLSRLFLGIFADQFGGRRVYTLVMVAAAAAVFLLSMADSYPMFLLAALGVGIAGGSFAVGIAYVSRWYPRERQGTALGFLGMGNVGSAVTTFGAPFILVAFGWETMAQVYALGMLAMATALYLLSEEDPVQQRRRASGQRAPGAFMQLEPLKSLQVWRFSLYYFFVFGAFVALALWLPRYYVGTYGLDITTASMLTAAYALLGSVFRFLGGWLSDRVGARKVMYATFIASLACLFALSYPQTDYVVHGIDGPIAFSFGIGLVPFVALTVVLGFFTSLGKAAVYKHIPVYYTNHVGSVGGLVGMIGGLGGFVLPIAFGVMNDLIGVWTSCFMLLFAIVAVALVWMHVAILRMERARVPELDRYRHFPELEGREPLPGPDEPPATARRAGVRYLPPRPASVPAFARAG